MPRAALLALTLALAAALAAATGCRTPPPAEKPPLPRPQIDAEVRHYAGTPVSGPTGAPGDAGSPDTALQVLATLIALEALPPAGGTAAALQPIGPQARLLLTDQGAAPLQPAADRLSGARAGTVEAAVALAAIDAGEWGRAARIGELRGVLPAGVTAAFELRRGDERLVMSVRRVREGGEGLELAIEVRARGDGGRVPKELAVLEPRPLSGRNDVALVAPSPFAGDEARAIAAVISVSSPPAAHGLGASAHRGAFAACRADLARDVVHLGREAPMSPATSPAAPDTALARAALADPERRRGALFTLAQGTGARLAEDIAIAAAEPLLATVTAAVAAELGRAFAPAEGPVLGWIVERGALRALEAARTEAIDAAALFLLRRAGAASRVEVTMRAIIERTKDIPDFERRLVEANVNLLDDADPAMRSRALEWLAARGLAPKGYDPLGTLEARRTALERAGGKK